MTTFIDFRYPKKLSSALLAGNQPEDGVIYFNPAEENYIAFEFVSNSPNGNLIDLENGTGSIVASIQIEKDHSISLRLTKGMLLLKTPTGSVNGNGNVKHILGFHLGPDTVGIKIHDSIYESQNCLPTKHQKLLLKTNRDDNSVSILGKGTGRTKRWAQLFYNRSDQNGLGVEIVMDWHHLRSGIPLNGTLTAEKLIELTNFRLNFQSYVLDKGEAQITDFVKLFSTSGNIDISLHITPPLYTRSNPETLNIGLFVSESKKLIPGIIARFNMMDSIIAPTTFVAEVYRHNKVNCPIYIVPHGVDLEFYKPVTKRIPLPGGREFNFLAVSTYVERKNIRHLVRAFLEEFRKNEDVALFLLLRPEYGTTQHNVTLEFDNWENKYFRNSAPILLSTSYTTRESLRDFYTNADAYVMPSNEGFGLTLLEAMASGTPVIALDYGGIKDFVNDGNGYLVSKGNAFISKDIDSIAYIGDLFYKPNVRKLRAAMRHVFENRIEACKKGLQGRIDCEKKYTWDQTATKIAKVIEKTYEKNHKRTGKNSISVGAKIKSNSLSWVLCVPDDTPIKHYISYLREKKTLNNDILCLFTRYARLKDIMLARKNGFLFHRWDGTYSNCKSTIHGIIQTPWTGILYPDEKIDGNLDHLVSFLDSLPEEVGEILISCSSRTIEPRFIRSHPILKNFEKRIYKKITIH